jgi:hypothetical protein
VFFFDYFMSIYIFLLLLLLFDLFCHIFGIFLLLASDTTHRSLSLYLYVDILLPLSAPVLPRDWDRGIHNLLIFIFLQLIDACQLI